MSDPTQQPFGGERHGPRPDKSPPARPMTLDSRGNDWHTLHQMPHTTFSCGHCGSVTAASEGINFGQSPKLPSPVGIYFCANCRRPTYFEDGYQLPTMAPVKPVSNLPDGVEAVYEESRRAFREGAYTLVVMGCRAILMHAAVEKGANEGARFVEYVDFLKSNGYVPTGSDKWVDRIRQLGNDGTHKVAPRGSADAIDALRFSEMLLRIIYEFPAQVV
jgi:Domain of unknown function (DUF4145)